MLAEAPYAVFGHSMGGHVAYELVCALRNRGAPLPCLLIVSGSRAPQLPPWSPLLYKMPDNALVRTLEERYGTRFEPGMLELVEMGLPTLRADLMVVETRSHRPAPLLPMPLLVLAGAADPGVPLADARAWARLAGDGCDVKVFSGGHFFPMMQRDAVLNCIRKALARIRQAAE
jgi:surfactin synthase thioesterase subunit